MDLSMALLCMLLIGMPLVAHSLAPCPSGMIVFGDSLSDSGNYKILYPSPSYSRPSPWVYTNPIPGRVGNNGYTLVDFIAMDLGFPPVQPNYGLQFNYFRRSYNDVPYLHGVNFAVASATARDTALKVPYYLSAQVASYVWWRRMRLISSELAANALHFIFFGTNDIVINSARNATIDQLRSTIVPQAIDSIMRGIEGLHGQGARNFMVVGMAAMGCLPMLLGDLATGQHSDYDSLGCFSPLNNVSMLHNTLLQERMALAQQQHPDSSYIYANLYNLHLDVLKDPKSGFSQKGIQAACCGGIGRAGHPVAQCTRRNVCSDPNSYVTWDGLHFTEAFNRVAAKFLLTGKYVQPIQENFNDTCKLHLNRFTN